MPTPIVSQVVLHDVPRIPVQGDIIKQHKLVSHSAFGNSLPGRRWGLQLYNMILVSIDVQGGVGGRVSMVRGQGSPQPSLPCSMRWIPAQSHRWAVEGSAGQGNRAWDHLPDRERAVRG